MKKFELSIDHPMLAPAKAALDACLKAMVIKAINTRSMEGTAHVKIAFDIHEELDEENGMVQDRPEIKFKAGYTVPIKDGCDGKIAEESRIIPNEKGGFILVNGQISMDELLDEDEGEEEEE